MRFVLSDTSSLLPPKTEKATPQVAFLAEFLGARRLSRLVVGIFAANAGGDRCCFLFDAALV